MSYMSAIKLMSYMSAIKQEQINVMTNDEGLIKFKVSTFL